MAAESFGNGHGSVESLEARYRHLDDRVGRLGQEVAGISATLAQVSSTLQAISHTVNAPRRTEWSAIIAACAFVASLGYSALMPVKETGVKTAEDLDAVAAKQRDVLEMVGEFRARMHASDLTHQMVGQSLEKLAERTYEAHARIAAAEALAAANTERLRDVDMAGSRKWVPASR
jgi:DNA anti-recombination protein RmuC